MKLVYLKNWRKKEDNLKHRRRLINCNKEEKKSSVEWTSLNNNRSGKQKKLKDREWNKN